MASPYSPEDIGEPARCRCSSGESPARCGRPAHPSDPVVAMTGRDVAAMLARRIGLPVAPADVHELAERGLVKLLVPGDWPFYEVNGVTCEQVLRVVEERIAWLTDSLDCWDAAATLDMSREAFREAAGRHGIRPGRFGRYRRADVARLRGFVPDSSGTAPTSSPSHGDRRGS
jgi:hypothetical protein